MVRMLADGTTRMYTVPSLSIVTILSCDVKGSVQGNINHAYVIFHAYKFKKGKIFTAIAYNQILVIYVVLMILCDQKMVCLNIKMSPP